jgi:eukaryotic-like serine/threonine-protein kinase
MPKVLGRYHIISELGRGGMGVVYKAVDPKLERFIAIKCLSEALSDDEITVTRFLREARNVAALNHPNIAQIFLADEDEGKPYFVMEFIDGESLADRLARDQRLMPEQARRIIIECAEALKAAHEENIVHRDIKPGNIMIDRRGRTVLTDFGIASIVHPDNQPKASKYIMGTPGYLPPEVMTGQAADHRGDIFALGAVYYEMLAGKRLVPGSGIEDTARTLLAADFPELSDLDEQLDQAAFGVLGRMLAPDPDKRYSDYDSLLADLRADAGNAVAQVADPASEATRVATPPPSAVPASAAGPAVDTAPATEAIDSAQNVPPSTLSSPPPAGRHRVRNASLIGVAALGLVVLVVGLARVAPDQWQQLSNRFIERGESTVADTETRAAPAAEAGQMIQTASELDFARIDQDRSIDDRALAEARDQDEPAIASLDAEPDHSSGALDAGAEPRISASAARVIGEEGSASMAASEPQASAPTTLVPAPEPEAASMLASDPVPARPIQAPDPQADTRMAMVESAPAPAASVTPAPREAPATVPPAGVLVLGIGDPVFVDPMIREVEQALAAEGHDLVERGFVRGLSAMLAESELDLTELSQAARAAGAGKAVIVRAMPAGQRQLQYYGRSDTAFIVQAETVTYDLNSGRRLGASDLAQIEYTALNATSQARNAIAPRLALISEQVGQN